MDWLSPVKGLFEFILPFLDRVPFIRAALGFIIVFLLPGFAWTLVFFRQINILERILLSFVLSLVVVTLSLLFANWIFNIRTTGLNSVLIIIVVTVVPVGIYYLRRFIRHKRTSEGEDEGD
jgi:uncharacterized membrane protein